MTTVHTDADRKEHLIAFTKGAPDVLIARCSRELAGEAPRPLSAERRAEILKINEELAGEALRTLAVAFRLLPKDAFERRPDAEEKGMSGNLKRRVVRLERAAASDADDAALREVVARPGRAWAAAPGHPSLHDGRAGPRRLRGA